MNTTTWTFACMRTGRLFPVSAEDAAWFCVMGVTVRLMELAEAEGR